MKKERIYITLLLLSISVYVTLDMMKPKPIDWSDDFTSQRTIPYGSKILFDELYTLFPDQKIYQNEKSIYLFNENSTVSKNWIFINSGFQFDELETKVLLEQVSKGDQIFIAGTISGAFADTLKLGYNYYYGTLDSTILQDSMNLSISSPFTSLNGSWKYNGDATFNYFTSYDSTRTTELGKWNNSYLNFIRIDVGDGVIYLNSNPYLFSNYYLRNQNEGSYAFHSLSHLPIQQTIWDSHYKVGKGTSGTPLYVILSTESLKYVWYLAVFSLFLFMIFRAKRKQRIIPIINTPENSTLNFTKTIGALYLEQGSHKNILEKKLLFFFDYIKAHLRMDTSKMDDKFKTNLADRSGISKREINKLFDLIDLTKNSKKITDNELKLVTDSIDQFYKNTNR